MRWSVLAGVTGIIFFLMAKPEAAYGHERWLVTNGAHGGVGFAPDLIMALVLAGAVFLLVFAFAIERAAQSGRWTLRAQRVARLLPPGAEWRILAGLTGIMFIVNALGGVFLAPNLVPDKSVLAILTLFQLIVGLLLLSQVAFLLAGLLILAALPLAALFFPFGLLIDYVFEFAAVGIALALVGVSSCPDKLLGRFFKVEPGRNAHLALTSARIGAGLTFLVLALNNKLLDANMALTFLDEYPLNFMALLGFHSFSDAHFVFAAGVMELTIGLLLIAGIATRLMAAAVAGLLFTTLVILGPAELVGHLPIIGLALLFLYRGAGPHRLSVDGWLRLPLRRPVEQAI